MCIGIYKFEYIYIYLNIFEYMEKYQKNIKRYGQNIWIPILLYMIPVGMIFKVDNSR